MPVPVALQKDMDFSSKSNVLQALEEAAAALNGSAGEDLGDAFKRYRQAVFKLNYKLNKLNNGKKCGKVRLISGHRCSTSAAKLGCRLKIPMLV